MASVETQTTTDNEKTRYVKALPYSNCCAYSGLIIIDLEIVYCPIVFIKFKSSIALNRYIILVTNMYFRHPCNPVPLKMKLQRHGLKLEQQ